MKFTAVTKSTVSCLEGIESVMVKQSGESRALPGKTLCTRSGFFARIKVNIVITPAKQFLFPIFDLVFSVNVEIVAHGCVSYIYPISI